MQQGDLITCSHFTTLPLKQGDIITCSHFKTLPLKQGDWTTCSHNFRGTYAFIWAALESDWRFLSIGEPIPIGGGMPGPDLPIPVTQMHI